MQKTRIVFMGTPDFAVESAQALLTSGAEIAAVVTAADKPAGRGLQQRESAMKVWAQRNDLDILQPQNLQSPEFLQALKNLDADLFIVVAFKILPKEVFEIPHRGTINLHASLLPKYRGAAPINWALIHGEKETGVTTFVIDEKVDTGALLLQKTTPIGENETFGELNTRLKKLGSITLVETVRRYMAGEIQPRPQVGEPSRAPKLTPELRQIDWTQPGEKIRNLIRGLSPIPAAYTTLHGKNLKIFSCQARTSETTNRPGEVVLVDAKAGVLEIGSGEGIVRLIEIQLEGKKRMDMKAFLRGRTVNVGDKVGQYE
ncbi:MAG: methionyl-tRNA formyltransferase [bacterium]